MKWLVYIWNFIIYRWGGGKERQAERERMIELDKRIAQRTKDEIREKAESEADAKREKTIDKLQDTEDF